MRRGSGTFGWDDEGVAAQRSVLVDQGLFTGYLSSRETAAAIGQVSNGTMRADGWSRLPIIRMTNVNLEPGTSSLEEMIATTEHGVYLETNRSWSIDDRRLNFQFGTQNGWEIVDGEADPPGAQPHLQRADAGVLAVVRRGRRPGGVADARRRELRQGSAVAVDARRPRRRPVPLPQRHGRAGAMSDDDELLARRRHARSRASQRGEAEVVIVDDSRAS